METVLFFIVLFLGISQAGLKRRVLKLEQEIGARHGGQTTVQQSLPVNPTAAQAHAQVINTPQNTTTPIAVVANTEVENAFLAWLQKDILMKVGALFLLMGFGWFVSYAFMNNWIGEFGRIMFGLIAGAGILTLGAWRIRTHEHQGAIFTVLGSTIVLLTVSAARSEYGIFDQYSALGIMFLSIVFVTVVSLKYNRNGLAVASLILAAIAPHLTTATLPDIHGQFLYLLVIVLGTLWVVYSTGWRNLTLIALCIVALTTIPYAVVGTDEMLALLWVFFFTAVFFVANIVSLVRQRDGITSQTNLYTALGTALFLVAWIHGAAPEELQSLLLVAWMLVFSVGAYLVFYSTAVRSPFYVYGGTAVALLAAATAAELEGTMLTIVLTFEVAVVVLTAYALRLGSSVVTTLKLLFSGPILLSFASLTATTWNSGVLHADFFNLIILALVLMIVGLATSDSKNTSPQSDSVGTGGVLVTLGAIYGLILIWLVLHAVASSDVATMSSLIIYTVIGLSMYFMGTSQTMKSLRIGGGFLLGFVVWHLLFIDVWNMALSGRIVTFFAIGILLLLTAFMGKKHNPLQK